MTNKYLEKIAANRFERYLLSQPADRQYDNPHVARAAKNLHDAKVIQDNTHRKASLGAKPEVLKAGADEAKSLIHRNRKAGSPFNNVFDKLKSIDATKHRSAMFPKIVPKMPLKHKLGLAAAGTALAGLGAYGVAKEIND